MKITMTEHDGCFSFDMTSETMEDAALLTRFSINVTNDVRSAGAGACKDGTFFGYCALGKRKNATNMIVRAR